MNTSVVNQRYLYMFSSYAGAEDIDFRLKVFQRHLALDY
ncbi:hypothetical protein VCRA2113O324_190029 [Vibrio crassostreae]|nr:hypothetical protein VCRA2113O324_190029 [Vibrio crassostreae]